MGGICNPFGRSTNFGLSSTPGKLVFLRQAFASSVLRSPIITKVWVFGDVLMCWCTICADAACKMFMASLCRHLLVVLLVVTLHKFSCHVSSDSFKFVLHLCNTPDYHFRVKVHHIWFFCCVILEYLLVSLLSNSAFKYGFGLKRGLG